jgi:hypothetical protein
MVLYLCVLIVFSLHQESLKMILVDEPPPRGGSITADLSLQGSDTSSCRRVTNRLTTWGLG